MPHLSIEPPAFFHRGPAPIARLAFFGLISIALLFIDTRYHYLEGIRRAAAIVLYPLQRAAQVPGEAIAEVATYFGSLHSLNEENTTLKRQLVERTAAAQGYTIAQQENARLRRTARRLVEDEGTIESVARETLGLIRPGEVLVVVKDLKGQQK